MIGKKLSRAPYLRMLLLVIAAFTFVAAAHVAIFFFTGTIANDALDSVIWAGAMIIGVILPARIYTRWKEGGPH